MQLRGALDSQICPDNSEIVAYISSGDIWAIIMVNGHNMRLTNAHDENKSSQVANTWINVNDVLEFIELTDTQVTFIWASEETGYRHLYLVSSLLQQSRQQSTDQCTNGILNSADNMKRSLCEPSIVSKVALTSGD